MRDVVPSARNENWRSTADSTFLPPHSLEFFNGTRGFPVGRCYLHSLRMRMYACRPKLRLSLCSARYSLGELILLVRKAMHATLSCFVFLFFFLFSRSACQVWRSTVEGEKRVLYLR